MVKKNTFTFNYCLNKICILLKGVSYSLLRDKIRIIIGGAESGGNNNVWPGWLGLQLYRGPTQNTDVQRALLTNRAQIVLLRS